MSYRREEFLYLTLPAHILNQPIARLGLGTGITNALFRGHIKTLGDLLEFTESELKRVPGIGAKSLPRILRALARQNLHLSRHMELNLTPPPGDEWVQLPRWRRLRSCLGHLPLLELAPGNSSLEALYHDINVQTVAQLMALTPQQILERRWAPYRLNQPRGIHGIIDDATLILRSYGITWPPG